MNKAITDGIVFTPPEFKYGLGVWSRGDGRPNSPSYEGWASAALVSADEDFGSCLEIVKTEERQYLRYMGETPLLPGCYLQIRARVKLISGNFPSIQISGYPGAQGGNKLSGVPEAGPAVTLNSYGEIFEVRAIVGTGGRSGVDMPWGPQAMFGHFGIEISGANGAVIRIDDIEIEDVTSLFLRSMMDWVDVKDYGAVGDRVTDDSAAFAAADTAAQAIGAQVLVSSGTYYLAQDTSFNSRVRFQGKVTMPANKKLLLRHNFDLDSYVDAFGDEVEAFKRAYQALVTSGDHDTLDLNGRSIAVGEPIDMASLTPGVTALDGKRVIANGQFTIVGSTPWTAGQISSSASYSSSNPLQLTDVQNVANIEVGSRVSGAGVGREVYVRSKNVGAKTITLSLPLYDANGTQNFTFKRYRYLLDFSGYDRVSRLNLQNIDFHMAGTGNCVMLSKTGLIWHFRDCDFYRPADRAITSIGTGCQGMQIDRCQFMSDQQSLQAQDRTTIAFNINANDAKIRNNRGVRWGHWAVVHGSGHLFEGNHWFQGDDQPNGARKAGLILTSTNSKIVINGNYIDNNYIEWNNEHDPNPEFAGELSFGSISITGNNFTSLRSGPWLRFIVIKPYGPGHFVNGLTVTGNTFKAALGTIDRVDKVDESIASLDHGRMRNIVWDNNTYHGIDQWTANPQMLSFNFTSPAKNWLCDFSDWLPFKGQTRNVVAMVPQNPLRNDANVVEHVSPYFQVGRGGSGGAVEVVWPKPIKGRINLTARMDDPY